jgi:uncharacterized protein (TIGR03435 family)
MRQMSHDAVTILIKVTIISALSLAGARLARRSRAALRHAVLAAAFGVMLVLPVASFIAPPVRIAVSVAQDRTEWPAATDPHSPIPPITRAQPAVIARGSASAPLPLWMWIWTAGTALALLPMLTGLWQIRTLRRSGRPWPYGQPVIQSLALDAGIHRRVELLLHEHAPGPMACGMVHPAIVLPCDAQTWNREDLRRALAHELEHVRRGDWVTHCLARAVCAAYWFHPLVWIAWRRLALEAERACDDAVLRYSEPTDYADQLVALAQRLSVAAKSPLLAMANRADLATRVGALLDRRQARGRAGAWSTVLTCAGALALVLTLSPLTIVAAPQSAPSPSATPRFEAASVKLIDPDSGGEHSSEHRNPKRLTMSGSLHRFIIRAYGITDGQLGSEPDWFKTRLYSIEAVTAAPARADQMMLMLRGLLAERFQLKLRQEDRELPVYALEVAPGGPKFKESKPGEIPRDEKETPGIFAKSYSSINQFLNSLNGVFGGTLDVDRPVVDRTNLTGTYNIQLRTAIERQTDDFNRRTFQFPTLFHDIQSELGLKLVPARVQMPYFVVEHASAPAQN